MNVECPHCKAAIQVPVSNAGEKANCPYCTGQFILPTSPYYSGTNSSGTNSSGTNLPPGNSLAPTADYNEFVSKKALAGIMGILFGAFGVHKFILGLSSAKIMLIVSLIGIILGSCMVLPGLALLAMSLVGLIEGVLYLTKSDEEFYKTYAIEKRQWL